MMPYKNTIFVLHRDLLVWKNGILVYNAFMGFDNVVVWDLTFQAVDSTFFIINKNVINEHEMRAADFISGVKNNNLTLKINRDLGLVIMSKDATS